MRTVIILAILLFSSKVGNGQNFPQFRAWSGNGYNEAVNFPSNGVASDYGPRNYSPKYFHYGI